jgi:hypothetical protein
MTIKITGCDVLIDDDMAEEKLNTCSPTYPYRADILDEPAYSGSSTAEKPLLAKRDIKCPVRFTSAWPGIKRGWGPITKNLEWEEV